MWDNSSSRVVWSQPSRLCRTLLLCLLNIWWFELYRDDNTKGRGSIILCRFDVIRLIKWWRYALLLYTHSHTHTFFDVDIIRPIDCIWNRKKDRSLWTDRSIIFLYISFCLFFGKDLTVMAKPIDTMNELYMFNSYCMTNHIALAEIRWLRWYFSY